MAFCIYRRDAQNMKQDSIKGKNVVISGSGNVAIYAAEKTQQLGGKGDCHERFFRLCLRSGRGSGWM